MGQLKEGMCIKVPILVHYICTNTNTSIIHTNAQCVYCMAHAIHMYGHVLNMCFTY